MKKQKIPFKTRLLTYLASNPKRTLKQVLAIVAAFFLCIGFLLGFFVSRSSASDGDITASAESVVYPDTVVPLYQAFEVSGYYFYPFLQLKLSSPGAMTLTVNLALSVSFDGSIVGRYYLLYGEKLASGATNSVPFAYLRSYDATGFVDDSELVSGTSPGEMFINSSLSSILPVQSAYQPVSISFTASAPLNTASARFSIGQNGHLIVMFPTTSATTFASVPQRFLSYTVLYGESPIVSDYWQTYVSTRIDSSLLYTQEQYDSYGSQNYTNGQAVGYQNGYDAGLQAGSGNSFLSLISAVVDAPIQALSSLFDVEILGFNMKSVFFALLSVSLVFAVFRLFSSLGL